MAGIENVPGIEGGIGVRSKILKRLAAMLIGQPAQNLAF